MSSTRESLLRLAELWEKEAEERTRMAELLPVTPAYQAERIRLHARASAQKTSAAQLRRVLADADE